jgi:hypothetical protein
LQFNQELPRLEQFEVRHQEHQAAPNTSLLAEKQTGVRVLPTAPQV